MCVGHFTNLDPDDDDPDAPIGEEAKKKLSFLLHTQVALACDTGAIYIMANYQVSVQYAHIFNNNIHYLTTQ